MIAQVSFSSIRKILEIATGDQALLEKIEAIVYPCLRSSLTELGICQTEEGIQCITMIVYNSYKDRPISKDMWALLPQLLFMAVGNDEDEYGGLGFEYVNEIALAIKNYISRDPEGMMKVSENQQKTHLDQVLLFIQRCLKINRTRNNDYLGSLMAIGLTITMFEAMH